MLDRIVEAILAIASWIPALFVDPNTHRFILIRGMFALMIVVLIIGIIAALPSLPLHAAWTRCVSKLTNLIAGKP